MLHTNLRMASEEDIDYVYRLICELEDHEFEYEKFKINFDYNLNNPNIQYYIIVDNNEKCGFISLYTNVLLHHNGKVMEIQEFIVDKRNRKYGIGSEIIRQVKKIAKAQNVLQLEVCTNKKREMAQRFYKKTGFLQSHYKYLQIL